MTAAMTTVERLCVGTRRGVAAAKAKSLTHQPRAKLLPARLRPKCLRQAWLRAGIAIGQPIASAGVDLASRDCPYSRLERLRRFETVCGPAGGCQRAPLTDDPGRWTLAAIVSPSRFTTELVAERGAARLECISPPLLFHGVPRVGRAGAETNDARCRGRRLNPTGEDDTIGGI